MSPSCWPVSCWCGKAVPRTIPAGICPKGPSPVWAKAASVVGTERWPIPPMAYGWPWQVASVSGSTMLAPVLKSPCSRGIQGLSVRWRSPRMGPLWPVVVSTPQLCCGMWPADRRRRPSKRIRMGSFRWRFRRMGPPWPVGVEDGTVRVVGCGQRAGEGHSPAYGEGPFGGVLPGWDHSGQ